MGQKQSIAFQNIFDKSVSQTTKIGMLGLSGAGKTAIVKKLQGEDCDNIVPTIGINIENIRSGNHKLTIWDVSASKLRTCLLWQHYNKNTKAIIFVIDSANIQELPQAAETFKWLWLHPQLKDSAFLIFANKQDLPFALSAQEICNYLDLNSENQQHFWIVQECCALNGKGVFRGIEKLLDLIEGSD